MLYNNVSLPNPRNIELFFNKSQVIYFLNNSSDLVNMYEYSQVSSI